jgi:tRNA-(ms[2]io[6]A)-hydroxylase
MQPRHQELTELPLRCWTSPQWAKAVIADDPLALLCDHAHLERKAASNALALLHRWPESRSQQELPERWVSTLTEIARDEINHLRLVLDHIIRRGGVFPKSHENRYAGDLRRVERRGEDVHDLVDRLLVSALIEARSCERYYLLAESVEEVELRKLYRGLWSSEKGHFQAFLELAYELQESDAVDRRWEEMLQVEAKIIQAQPFAQTIHSWV